MSAGCNEKYAVSLLEIKAEAMRRRHKTISPMTASTVNPVKKLFETTERSPMRGSGSGVSKILSFNIEAAKIEKTLKFAAIFFGLKCLRKFLLFIKHELSIICHKLFPEIYFL
jgi:hypothetical protein